MPESPELPEELFVPDAQPRTPIDQHDDDGSTQPADEQQAQDASADEQQDDESSDDMDVIDMDVYEILVRKLSTGLGVDDLAKVRDVVTSWRFDNAVALAADHAPQSGAGIALASACHNELKDEATKVKYWRDAAKQRIVIFYDGFGNC